MWPNPQENADLVTFTEEVLNGKLHFLRSDHKLALFIKSKYDWNLFLPMVFFEFFDEIIELWHNIGLIYPTTLIQVLMLHSSWLQQWLKKCFNH